VLLRNFDCLKYFLPEEARFKLPIYRSGSFRIRPIYSSRIMMMMSFFILHPNFGTIYPHHCSHTTCVGIQYGSSQLSLEGHTKKKLECTWTCQSSLCTRVCGFKLAWVLHFRKKEEILKSSFCPQQWEKIEEEK